MRLTKSFEAAGVEVLKDLQIVGRSSEIYVRLNPIWVKGDAALSTGDILWQ
jgi:hypothetical protein